MSTWFENKFSLQESKYLEDLQEVLDRHQLEIRTEGDVLKQVRTLFGSKPLKKAEKRWSSKAKVLVRKDERFDLLLPGGLKNTWDHLIGCLCRWHSRPCW